MQTLQNTWPQLVDTKFFPSLLISAIESRQMGQETPGVDAEESTEADEEGPTGSKDVEAIGAAFVEPEDAGGGGLGGFDGTGTDATLELTTHDPTPTVLESRIGFEEEEREAEETAAKGADDDGPDNEDEEAPPVGRNT